METPKHSIIDNTIINTSCKYVPIKKHYDYGYVENNLCDSFKKRKGTYIETMYPVRRKLTFEKKSEK